MFGQKVLLASALIFVLLVSGCVEGLFGGDKVSKIKECIDLPTKQQQDQCFEELKAGGVITEDDCEKLVGEYSQYRQKCLELFQKKSTDISKHIDEADDGLQVARNLGLDAGDGRTFLTGYETEYFALRNPSDVAVEEGRFRYAGKLAGDMYEVTPLGKGFTLDYIDFRDFSPEELLEAMTFCEGNFCDAAQFLAQVQLRLHLLESLRQSPEVTQLDCSYCDYKDLLEKVLESEVLPNPVGERFAVNFNQRVSFSDYPPQPWGPMREIWIKIHSELENGLKAKLKYTSFDDFAAPFSASNVEIEEAETGSFFSMLPQILYSDHNLTIEPFSRDLFFTNFNEVSFSESCGEHMFDLTMKYNSSLNSGSVSLQAKGKEELPEYCEVKLENLGNALNSLNTFVVAGTDETKLALEKVTLGVIPLTHVVKTGKLPSEESEFDDLRTALFFGSRITPRTIITVDADSKTGNVSVEEMFSNSFWIKIDATSTSQAAELLGLVLKKGQAPYLEQVGPGAKGDGSGISITASGGDIVV